MFTGLVYAKISIHWFAKHYGRARESPLQLSFDKITLPFVAGTGLVYTKTIIRPSLVDGLFIVWLINWLIPAETGNYIQEIRFSLFLNIKV